MKGDEGCDEWLDKTASIGSLETGVDEAGFVHSINHLRTSTPTFPNSTPAFPYGDIGVRQSEHVVAWNSDNYPLSMTSPSPFSVWLKAGGRTTVSCPMALVCLRKAELIHDVALLQAAMDVLPGEPSRTLSKQGFVDWRIFRPMLCKVLVDAATSIISSNPLARETLLNSGSKTLAMAAGAREAFYGNGLVLDDPRNDLPMNFRGESSWGKYANKLIYLFILISLSFQSSNDNTGKRTGETPLSSELERLCSICTIHSSEEYC